MAKARLKLKIKDRNASEQKLIEAAEEAFSKHGFDGATTRDIANKAGVNLALIARYFEGKYGLLLAVLERKMSAVRDSMLGEQKATLSEECVSYTTFRFNEITKDLDFFRIVIAKFLTDEKFLKQFVETISLETKDQELVERLELFVKQKKTSPKLNVLDLVEVLERNIVAMVLFEVIMKKTPPDKALIQLKSFVSTYVSSFEK